MKEIWLIIDPDDNIEGFVLTQDEAFCVAAHLTIESLNDEGVGIYDDDDNTECKHLQEIIDLFDGRDFRKAYYKTRDHFYNKSYTIKGVPRCTTKF